MLVDNRRTVMWVSQIDISNRVSRRSLVKLAVEGTRKDPPNVGPVPYSEVGTLVRNMVSQSQPVRWDSPEDTDPPALVDRVQRFCRCFDNNSSTRGSSSENALIPNLFTEIGKIVTAYESMRILYSICTEDLIESWCDQYIMAKNHWEVVFRLKMPSRNRIWCFERDSEYNGKYIRRNILGDRNLLFPWWFYPPITTRWTLAII